jgi:glycosyltransferase involved in cell wall biosynthesis
MAAALSESLAKPEERLLAMGEKGQAWMQRDFSWDGVARAMLDLYRWLAEENDRPAFVHLA